MADLTAPTAQSPLRAWGPGAASAGVLMEDLCLRPKVLVRAADVAAATAALGTRFGRAHWDGDTLVAGSGPGEWFLIGAACAPGGADAAADALADESAGLVERTRTLLASTSGLVTVIDQTHGRALARLKGPGVRDLLGHVSAFDFDDRFVPDGAAWRTSVARVVCDLIRDDIGGEPSYLLHCERSSGPWLFETLGTITAETAGA